MQLNRETLLQSIRQNKLFPPESRLILAVSGGTDSLALMHCLAHLRPIYPLELIVATLNHGLRPEAAEEVEFVQAMARAWNLHCITGRVNLGKTGIEATARKARYDFLAEIAQSHNIAKVVTAHQADDQSETILMHLIRGSGLQGLTGMSMIAPMPYHPEYQLVRPLLPFSRAAIEAYCAEHGLEPRQDMSNFDTTYRRNAIRHEIVPRLRQLNPQIDAALARLGQLATAEDEFIQHQFKKTIVPQMEFAERVTMRRESFLSWHIAMQRRAVLAALAHLNVVPDFERIESAIEIIVRGNVGAILEFSETIQLRLDYETILIEDRNSQFITNSFPQLINDESISLTFPKKLQNGNFELCISTVDLPDRIAQIAIPDNAKLILRSRRDGDTFKPLGMAGKSRKLKKWLIDRKIPQYLRDKLPLLEVNGEIAAIILPESWGISETFAVHPDSENVLYFSVKKL
jgi:tRNA(Ile)-lysidine synthase